MSAILSVSGLHVSYKAVPAVSGVDLEIEQGEVRVILGANGAGKTTIIKSILGLLKPKQGAISFAGHDLLRLEPHAIHGLGISWVPEGRQLWGTLTVLDNLRMGAFSERDDALVARRIEKMFDRFPQLRERRDQVAGSLSGGEQQMVAIARAMVSQPKLLLLDEPSLGLAPLIVKDVFDLVREINRELGVSILLVEQNAREALSVCDRAYVLAMGENRFEGEAKGMLDNEEVGRLYLGA